MIEYLLKPETQITTLRVSSFYPVINVPIPADLDPGLENRDDSRFEPSNPPRTPTRPCSPSALAPIAVSPIYLH